MSLRGPGLTALSRHTTSAQAYNHLSSQLTAQQLTDLRSQLETFSNALRNFASAHRNDILKDPEFRGEFQRMCANIGVDPLAAQKRTSTYSQTHTWPLTSLLHHHSHRRRPGPCSSTFALPTRTFSTTAANGKRRLYEAKYEQRPRNPNSARWASDDVSVPQKDYNQYYQRPQGSKVSRRLGMPDADTNPSASRRLKTTQRHLDQFQKYPALRKDDPSSFSRTHLEVKSAPEKASVQPRVPLNSAQDDPADDFEEKPNTEAAKRLPSNPLSDLTAEEQGLVQQRLQDKYGPQLELLETRRREALAALARLKGKSPEMPDGSDPPPPKPITVPPTARPLNTRALKEHRRQDSKLRKKREKLATLEAERAAQEYQSRPPEEDEERPTPENSAENLPKGAPDEERPTPENPAENLPKGAPHVPRYKDPATHAMRFVLFDAHNVVLDPVPHSATVDRHLINRVAKQTGRNHDELVDAFSKTTERLSWMPALATADMTPTSMQQIWQELVTATLYEDRAGVPDDVVKAVQSWLDAGYGYREVRPALEVVFDFFRQLNRGRESMVSVAEPLLDFNTPLRSPFSKELRLPPLRYGFALCDDRVGHACNRKAPSLTHRRLQNDKPWWSPGELGAEAFSKEYWQKGFEVSGLVDCPRDTVGYVGANLYDGVAQAAEFGLKTIWLDIDDKLSNDEAVQADWRRLQSLGVKRVRTVVQIEAIVKIWAQADVELVKEARTARKTWNKEWKEYVKKVELLTEEEWHRKYRQSHISGQISNDPALQRVKVVLSKKQRRQEKKIRSRFRKAERAYMDLLRRKISQSNHVLKVLQKSEVRRLQGINSTVDPFADGKFVERNERMDGQIEHVRWYLASTMQHFATMTSSWRPYYTGIPFAPKGAKKWQYSLSNGIVP